MPKETSKTACSNVRFNPCTLFGYNVSKFLLICGHRGVEFLTIVKVNRRAVTLLNKLTSFSSFDVT